MRQYTLHEAYKLQHLGQYKQEGCQHWPVRKLADFTIYFNILTTKEGIAEDDGFQTNNAHARHCKNSNINILARRIYHLNMKL